MRSSSSSGPEGAFQRFVTMGLRALRDELPWAYARTALALAGRDVLLTVSDEAVPVRATADEVTAHVSAPEGFAPQVALRTARGVIVRLADAELSIVDAVISGEVSLRGDVDDLVAFHDGLMAFLHGAVRSPSFPALLDDFRRWAEAPAADGVTSWQTNTSRA